MGAELTGSGCESTCPVFSLTLSRFFLMPSSSRWICCRSRKVPHQPDLGAQAPVLGAKNPVLGTKVPFWMLKALIWVLRFPFWVLRSPF